MKASCVWIFLSPFFFNLTGNILIGGFAVSLRPGNYKLVMFYYSRMTRMSYMHIPSARSFTVIQSTKWDSFKWEQTRKRDLSGRVEIEGKKEKGWLV